MKITTQIYTTLFLLISFLGYTQQPDVYTSRLEGSAIDTTAELLLMENQYPLMEVDIDWRDKWQYGKVENKVTLKLNPKVALTTDLSASVTVDVTSRDEDGLESMETRTLAVSYLADGTQNITDKSSYVFEGGHLMEVNVTNVVVQGDINALVLEAEIGVERYFKLDRTSEVTGIGNTTSNGYVTIYWDHTEGAEEYELEYVHVNDYTLEENVFKSPNALAVDFYKNSTRVSTSENWYKLPAVFDHGYLVYRVRAVGRHWEDVSKRLEGVWNAETTQTVADYPANHKLAITTAYLSGTKNWSYQAAMTEDGKRAEGVSYADGLGRPRQQVMRNPVTEQTVVSNTYYDYHGRPVIQDLGTPVDDEELKHHPDFNKSAVDGTSYQAEHFDNLGDPNSEECTPMPDAFSTTSGAGKYYSTANTQADGANKYVPDAEGYPFSHIEYMPDQTGRIKRVGANGATHQLSGKSSEYIYSTPSQEELNVLFGSEVGENHQYQKRLMKDANGQLYITYYDLAGRVIASGMAGEAPENLEDLDGVNPIGNFEQTILDGSQGGFLTSWSKPEVIESNGTYYFNYSFTPEQYTDLCNAAPVCFDCVYDLRLKIEPTECAGEEAILDTTIQINGANLDKACSTPEQYAMEELEVYLTQGTYQVTRELSVNEASVDEYWCMYLEDNTCAPSFTDIFNTYYTQEDFDWCLNPDEVEDINQGDFEYTCDYSRALMLSHFSLGGQYALFDVSQDVNGVTVIDASNYPLSIFNTNNYLPSGVTWQTPTEYLDSEGQPIYVDVEEVSTGVYSPAVVSTDPSDLIYVSAGLYKTSPANLLNAKDFIQLMRYEDDTWREALLPYHPEYCNLEFCEDNITSEDYDKAMQEVQLHADACSMGYYNPVDYTMPHPATYPLNHPVMLNCIISNNPATDPFFSNPLHAAYKTAMQAEMEVYHTYDNGQVFDIWSYAILTVIRNVGENGPTEIDKKAVASYNGDPCYDDLIWETFRSLYLTLKQKYVSLAMLDHAMENGCFSGCFGVDSFDESASITNFDANIPHSFDNYEVLGTGIPLNPSPSSTTAQPCHSSTVVYYAEKQTVFGLFWQTYSEAMDYAGDQTGFESDLATANEEQCMTVCEESADDWMNGLLECDNLTPAIRTAVRAELIELCQLGCPSGENPQGVYNLETPLQTANGNTSFEEVLAYHLSTVSTNYGTDECTVYLMNNLPPVWGGFISTVNNTVANQVLDDCGCDLLLEQSIAFNSTLPADLPQGVETLSDYVTYNTGEYLSEGQIKQMLCNCEQAYLISPSETEWTLPSNWYQESKDALADLGHLVPPAYTCNKSSGVGCVDCDFVATKFTALHNEFIANGVTDITALTNSFNYPLIVENYFNLTIGFNVSGEEIIAFQEGCQATPTAPVCEPTEFTSSYMEGMLDLLAKRGQLQTPSTAPIDLTEENVVYAHAKANSEVPTPGDLFWTCESTQGCDDEHLSLNFGDGQGTPCSIDLTLEPAVGEIVSFDQVIGFSDFALGDTPANCTDQGGNFSMIAHYIDCGEIKQVYVSGSTTCMDLYTCVCGDEGQVLCDELVPEVDALHCYKPQLSEMIEKTADVYESNIDDLYTEFKENYTGHCKEAFSTEKLTRKGDYFQYQFTLFYYDQAGNLVKTIAPEGVDNDFINQQGVTHAGIKQARENVSGPDDTDPQAAGFFPDHEYVTEYHYNSYGQLTQTTNPDQEGYTQYFYDRYGRIVASQNPHQAATNIYSYTYYDNQGRPKEVGQVQQPTNVVRPTEQVLKTDDLGAGFKNWVENNNGIKAEVTITIYDESLSTDIENQFTNGQTNLRLRVASILYFDEFTATTDIETDYTTATHYSYDVHGNVVETIQDVPMMAPVNQDKKKTEYEFELISGNVKAVHYQKEERDGYSHYYHYDELNRLTEVETTTDEGVNVASDARYHYFDYGPLARVELGEYQVQGMDYAYTINGWIKGMNSNTLDATRDMGRDGVDASQDPQLIAYLNNKEKIHSHFAKDVFGFTLNYFDGDYKAVGQNAAEFEAAYAGTNFDTYNQGLYNGNIRHVVTAIDGGVDDYGDPVMPIQGYGYKYDQLQRLKEMRVFSATDLVANNSWSSAVAKEDYFTQISYDKNGNIESLKRNGNSDVQLAMDDFHYNYLEINGEKSNRLDYVDDLAPDHSGYDDIKEGQITGNYKYNKLGELIEDVQENMKLHWRYGDHKLQKIERTDDGSPEVEFYYNPLGVRIGKLVKPRENGQLKPQSEWTYHYYAYDANGMLMGVYQSATSEYTYNTSGQLSSVEGENAIINLEERYIYGASRVGAIKEQVRVYGGLNQIVLDVKDHTLGQKRYHLTNHLGTVNVTISDRKTYNPTDNHYEAVVTSYAETYAFGMLMPGRATEELDSRYLYHGMERDPEISNGNSYTTEFRQYDPRLGRWKSLDPLMSSFPHMSPYVGFANNPIYFVDPYGLAPSNDGGDPEKETESGDVPEWSKDGAVTQLPDITVRAEGATDQLKARATGQGDFAKGGKYEDDYGSDAWHAFMNRTFGNADGFQLLQSWLRNKRITQSEHRYIYNNFARRGDGLNVKEGSNGQWQEQANSVVMEGKSESLERFKYVWYGGMAVGGIYALPAIISSGSFSFIGQGLRLYHYNVGLNGGYVNMGLNWINQSYVTDNWGLEGKSITGLIMAGSLRYNSTLGGQMLVGAADPWWNVTYSNNNGLESRGYLFNSSYSDKPSLLKTTGLSIMGAFNSIYMANPLMKSELVNFLIGNGLMAPGQKAITDEN